MASDNTSRSSSAADSYIGCLISLTSKSEIRYEGVLYNINTDESSIGLRNVRSFGTEGRKKDGPQIPPGDKVYEYILFRGTDIKDLQVKSSPSVQPTPPSNTDPAIIQSQYPRPVTTPTNLPAISGSLTDLSSHTTQHGHPGSNFQGTLPLYQPGGNIGSWGASSPVPNSNGGGLAMPLYWQGYYGSPNGLPQLPQQSQMPQQSQLPQQSQMPQQSQLPQQSLLRPPPGLPMPSSMQQPMQFPNFSPSLPTGPSNMAEFRPAFLPVGTSSPSMTSSTPSPNLPSTLPPAPSATLAPETFQASFPNKAQTASLSAVKSAANLSSLTPFSNGGLDRNAAVPLVNKPNTVSGSSLSFQTVSQLTPAIVGSSKPIRTEPPVPSLVTPAQILQSGPPTAVSSSQPSQTPHKDVEVVQVSATSSPEPSVPVSAESQPPILPLPATSRPNHRSGGASIQTHHGYGYRGRGRGRGPAGFRPVERFTEDFDFIAMNEKFKKDEVWGHLGKSTKAHSKEKDGEENSNNEDSNQDDDNGDTSKSEAKAVYNKDDFFDSLSCTSLDRDQQNGRLRYSEQVKIDTETFGDFSRQRGGGWGGRGPWRGGGRSRGGYYGRGYDGRGYGYAGRGRGRGPSGRN